MYRRIANPQSLLLSTECAPASTPVYAIAKFLAVSSSEDIHSSARKCRQPAGRDVHLDCNLLNVQFVCKINANSCMEMDSPRRSPATWRTYVLRSSGEFSKVRSSQRVTAPQRHSCTIGGIGTARSSSQDVHARNRRRCHLLCDAVTRTRTSVGRRATPRPVAVPAHDSSTNTLMVHRMCAFHQSRCPFCRRSPSNGVGPHACARPSGPRTDPTASSYGTIGLQCKLSVALFPASRDRAYIHINILVGGSLISMNAIVSITLSLSPII